MDFPEQSLDEAEKAAAELSLNRSNFIRAAVTEYIKELRRRSLDLALAEGYPANAKLSQKIAEEFAHVDSKIA